MNMRPFIKKNASTILTCMGVVGVFVTTVMAAKATLKVLEALEDGEKKKGEKLTKWEKVNVASPVYIPTVITGMATIACVLSSNIINKRQQAALVSAYALLDSSYREYRKKVEELNGEKAGEQIRAEITKDKYAGNSELSEDDNELFFDFYSGRYFESTKEMVMRAQYEINRAMSVDGVVSINEYYALLGLEQKPEYELVGWSRRQIEKMHLCPWIDFNYEDVTIDEESEESGGVECIIIYLVIEPFIDYLDY